VAGLAHALEKETLLMQAGAEPVPLDLRDYVKIFNTIEAIRAVDTNVSITAYSSESGHLFQFKADTHSN
jgi:hypothetical protein